MDLRRKAVDQILRRAARIHVVQVEVHRGIDEVLDVVRVDGRHGAGPVRIDVREGLLAGPDAEKVDRILIDDVRLRPCLVRKKKVQAPVFVRDVLRAAAHLQLVDDVRGRHVVALQFIDAFAGAELELGAEDVGFLSVTDQVFRTGLIRIDRQRKVVFLRKALCDGKAIVAVAEGKGLRFRVFRDVAHFEHTRRPVVGRQDQDGHEPTKIAGQGIGPKIRVRQVRIDVHVIGRPGQLVLNAFEGRVVLVIVFADLRHRDLLIDPIPAAEDVDGIADRKGDRDRRQDRHLHDVLIVFADGLFRRRDDGPVGVRFQKCFGSVGVTLLENHSFCHITVPVVVSAAISSITPATMMKYVPLDEYVCVTVLLVPDTSSVTFPSPQ